MDTEQPQQHSGPSWGLMLALLFLAILVASGIAYWLIYPYVHPHPR
jgi:NhaP-type Na+/H+ or K+/H+ antiporter